MQTKLLIQVTRQFVHKKLFALNHNFISLMKIYVVNAKSTKLPIQMTTPAASKN